MALIRASEGSLRIGSDSYTAKKLLNFVQAGEVYKDSTGAGFLKHVGNPDVNFDIELFIDRSDVPGFITMSKTDANGAIPTETFQLTYTDIGGSSVTISGTGFISSFELVDSGGEEKLVGRLHVEYTGTPTAA